MARIEVEMETARQYLADGGTIWVHPAGSFTYSGFTIEPKNATSIEHGLAQWRDEGNTGTPLLLIDSDDPHPKNPVKQTGETSWAIA